MLSADFVQSFEVSFDFAAETLWVQTTERYLGCKQNLGHPVNVLFHLKVIAVTCTITGSVVIEKPDRIVYEHGVGSDQERADTRTSARNAGYGNSSV